MSYWAYLFEAHSLQEYILDGRNLAEQTAAGDLIAGVCGEPLSAVLDILSLADGTDIRFIRRTAGAFHAVLGGDAAAGQAQRLRDLWGIACAAYCPGLSFAHALAEGDTEHAAFRRALRELSRQRPAAVFPEAPPLARRDPHSGGVAVFETGREWRDAAALRKHQALALRGHDRAPLAAFGLADLAGSRPHTWPVGPAADSDRHAPGFPWLPGNRYLALVHCAVHGADAALSSLDARAARQPERFLPLFQGFSAGMADAIGAAARQALAACVIPASEPAGNDAAVIPGLPLLIRDNAFSLLVRADLALPFAAAFCAEFERASATTLAGLRAEFPQLPSICAGIAYVKTGWPLIPAYRLAETLCDRARHESDRARPGGTGPRTAGLAFARIADGTPENGPDSAPRPEDFRQHTGLPAYGASAGPLPGWRPLAGLASLLAEEDLAVGPTRQLLALLRLAPGDAARQYRRWREVLGKVLPQHLDRFDALLADMGLAAKDLPVVRVGELALSPLADALLLRAVGHGAPARPTAPTRYGHG